jgi:hypothetical protein
MDVKKKYPLIFGVFFLAYLNGISQNNPVQMQTNLDNLANSNYSAILAKDDRYEGVKGSPFLSDQWLTGKVHAVNGKVYENVDLKYDIYNQEIYYRNPKNNLVTILNTFEISEFKLDVEEKERKFIRFNEKTIDPGLAGRFFEVVADGKVKLLKLHLAIFKKASYQGAYAAGNRYDEFQPQSELWIYREDKAPDKLKKNAKKLAEWFDSDQVLDYIKIEKTDLSDEESLIELFQKFE